MTLRSCLRWKPTGKIFRTVGLRWVPTGKIFTPIAHQRLTVNLQNGSICRVSLTNMESAQTLDVSETKIHALSWGNPCQGDSLNLPDHRFRRRCCSLIPAKSDS
ncbi:hypothetical protein Tco_0752497 [Tanacetum coccineum]|uniref:Uncharacterized protein n=1 Tax=Tanacetum coccineum TaxID=301880 RepID=A0ABQ4Z895_9ASTR